MINLKMNGLNKMKKHITHKKQKENLINKNQVLYIVKHMVNILKQK